LYASFIRPVACSMGMVLIHMECLLFLV
jgi:hypothetical protein